MIIGLVGRDAGLEEEVRGARLIPNDKNDIGLRTADACGQFGKIDAADPFFLIGPVSGHKEVRILPRTFNEPCLRIHRRHRLRDASESHRAVHRPCAGASIPPHSIDLKPVKAILRVNVELNRVPPIHAGERGKPLDLAMQGRVSQTPLCRAGAGIPSLDRIAFRSYIYLHEKAGQG